MAVSVMIIDELYNVIVSVGYIETDDMRYLIRVANELDTKCLGLTDFVGDTFFNEKQMRYMQKEIDVLRTRTDVSKAALDIIQEGVDEGLKDMFLYLKFDGE